MTRFSKIEYINVHILKYTLSTQFSSITNFVSLKFKFDISTNFFKNQSLTNILTNSLKLFQNFNNVEYDQKDLVNKRTKFPHSP